MSTGDLTFIIELSQWDAQSRTVAVTARGGSNTLTDPHPGVQINLARPTWKEPAHVRAYGMDLYSRLFVKDVMNHYQQMVGETRSGGAIHVQLEIRGHAPELHAVPWELLWSASSKPVAISADSPFSRFLVSGSGDHPAVLERPLHLLLAIANPETLPYGLNEIEGVEETVSVLADLVKAENGKIVGTILPGGKPLAKELRERLEREHWTIDDGVTSWQNILEHLPGQHVLHIISHGVFKTADLFSVELELSGELDKGEAVPATLKEEFEKVDRALGPGRRVEVELAGHTWAINDGSRRYFMRMETDGLTVKQSTAYLLLEPHLGDEKASNLGVDLVSDETIVSSLTGRLPMPQLIFLAACESAKRPETGVNAFVGLGPRLVEAGVPAVVAMQDEVPMTLIPTLTARFYQDLFQHGQVDRALNVARASLFKPDSFDWAIPVLFMHLKDGLLFGEGERRTVLFDVCHGQDDWYPAKPTINDGFREIANLARERAEVSSLVSIDDEFLRACKALVLTIGPEGKTFLTEDEIKAIRNLVHRGGGLLVLGAYTGDWHHEANLNELLNVYGMAFNRNVVLQPRARVEDGRGQSGERKPNSKYAADASPAPGTLDAGSHDVLRALLAGVSSVRTLGACSLYVNQNVATAVLQSSSRSVILEPDPIEATHMIKQYLKKGHGPATLLAASTTSRVVVCGCWTMFLNDFIDEDLYDNKRLFRNILDWLIG